MECETQVIQWYNYRKNKKKYQINKYKLPLKLLWCRKLELSYLLEYECENIEVYLKHKQGKVYRKSIVEKTFSKLNYLESQLIVSTIYSKYSSETMRYLSKIKQGEHKHLNERTFLKYGRDEASISLFTEINQ